MTGIPIWVSLVVPAALVIGAAILIGLFMWRRPDRVSTLRINVIWLSTLVSVLTLTFGLKLIDELAKPKTQPSSSTIEVVLSSLVGVGIGGLIAIAGQLVQDSGGTSDSENSSRQGTTATQRNSSNPPDISNGNGPDPSQ